MSLDTIASEVKGEIDLLKLDIEGAESALLSSARPEVLGRIRRIALEYHATGHVSREEMAETVQSLLQRAGFKCLRLPERSLLFARRECSDTSIACE